MASENESEKRETLADVVAIVRRAAQCYEGEAEQSEGLLRESFKLSAASYREIANLVEAAWKREKAEWEAAACACVSDAVISGRVAVEHPPVGNAAALREALETVRKYVKETTPDKVMLGVIEVWCDEALAKPPRNCDVGTEQEQHRRFLTFCNAHIYCADCPIKAYWTKALSCGILWAQMPYEAEEGGAK